MILQIWRYALRGRQSHGPQKLAALPPRLSLSLGARNLEDLVGYLRTTAYGQTLSGWDWRRGDAEAELSRRLYGDLARAFLKVRRGLKSGSPVSLISCCTGWRRKTSRSSSGPSTCGWIRLRPRRGSAPYGLSTLDFQEMLRQETIPRLVDYLAPTIWGPPLKKGLSRFEREANLFPLEMSLDLLVYASLWQGPPGFPGSTAASPGTSWAPSLTLPTSPGPAASRDLYGFPAKETYQYLIEVGSFISPAARHNLAFAINTGEMILRLPRKRYVELLQGAKGPGGSGGPAPAALDGHPGEKPGGPPSKWVCPSRIFSSRNWSWTTSSP